MRAREKEPMKGYDPKELESFSVKDPRHDAIPRTPAERKTDRETNAWLRKAEKKRRDQGRKR